MWNEESCVVVVVVAGAKIGVEVECVGCFVLVVMVVVAAGGMIDVEVECEGSFVLVG